MLAVLSILLLAGLALAQDLQAISDDDDDDGHHRAPSIELSCPDLKCPDTKCGACICGPGAARKRRPSQCKGQTWLNQFGDASGKNYNPKSGITKETLANLTVAWQTPTRFGGTSSYSWGGTTTDGKTVYTCATEGTVAGFTTKSFVVALDYESGDIRWARQLENYLPSGYVYGVRCRAAPAISGDYIFVTEESHGLGAAAQSHRTFGAPVEDNPPMFNPFTPGNPQAAAFVPLPPLGRPKQLIKINRHTGDLVWSRDIGKKAVWIDDEDNFDRMSGSPIAFELDAYNTGEEIPVIALGTSASTTTFFFGSQGFSPAAVYGIPPEVFPPNGIPTLGRIAAPLALRAGRFRPSNVGKVYIYDARDGREISQIKCTAEPYKTGDRLEARSLFPGKDDFQIRHWVQAEDLAPGGGLNPISRQFAGRQTLVYTLETRARFIAQSLRNVIPAPLDGIEIQLKSADPDNVPGEVVTLVAGAEITDLMEGLVVEIETEFVENSTEFEYNGVIYDLLDESTDLTDTDGQYDTPAVLIRRRLRVGDVLDRAAAFEASAWGSNVWGNGNPAVVYDKHGKPRELVFGCGQSQRVPYEWTDFQSGIGPYERDERRADGNEEYVQATADTARLINLYREAKTASRRDALRARIVKTQQRNANNAARIEQLGSEDMKRNGWDGAIVASLRPGHIGEVTSVLRTRGVDSWTATSFLSYHAVTVNFSLADILPVPTDIGLYDGTPYSEDADHGQVPSILYGGGENGEDLIVLATKGGDYVTYALEEAEGCKKGAARVAVLKHRVTGGHPFTTGGSNFGLCSDNEFVYDIYRNAEPNDLAVLQALPSSNFAWQTGLRGSRNPMPANLFELARGWLPLSSDEVLPDLIPYNTAYVLRYNPRKNTIDYEVEQPGGSSARVCTVNKDLLFAPAGDGSVGVHDKATGELLSSVATDAGFILIGQHALVGNDIVIFPRSTPAFGNTTNPGSVYRLTVGAS